MENKNAKEKRYENLRKKRIWPSIVIFLGGAFLCTIMVGISVLFFTAYVLTAKVEYMYEETLEAGECFDKLLEKGGTVQEVVQELALYMPQCKEIYIVDESCDTVISTSSSEPDFDVLGNLSTSGEINVIGDSEEDYMPEDGDALLTVPLEEIFKGSFTQSGESESDMEWLREEIYKQKFWMQADLKHQTYRLYVKYTLQIQRKDVAFLYAFSILAVCMLSIPIIFLFANTIRVTVMQRRMTKLLYLDMVTGGWNWIYFQNSAERILTRHHNRKQTYALVELYMERYHNYCSCYGVKAGEELLENMEGFLRARTAKGELHVRYEGSAFALLLCCKGQNEQECRNDCQKRVRSLLAELTGLRPEQKLYFCAGIYMVYPNVMENGRFYADRRNVDISWMYNCANTARREADNRHEQGFAFFEQEMLEKQLWNRNVVENIEEALREEAFQVYLQPKYNPADARIVGAEALVRWKNKAGEIILPNRFLPVLEENGFMTQLDDYMVSHVAKLLAEWTIQGRKVLPVSVNISNAHLSQEGLAEHICKLVDAYGTKHELIELEVTESAFFDEKDILTETVKQLKAYGFRVSLDDFGSGYSSLNSLKDMQLDAVKLDTEFFRGENDLGRGAIIVREVLQLTRSLHIYVVAEGIEKKEQADFLTELGCDMIQGFYFAKPMPVCEFEEKMEKEA